MTSGSLELYAPLDQQGVTGDDPFVNLAQSSTVINQNITGVRDNDLNKIPDKFGLYNNYPNPFNPTTIIKYAVPKTSYIELHIFNILGQKVTTLVNTIQNPGYYEVSFGNLNIASGIYLYRLSTDSFSETKKMMLVK